MLATILVWLYIVNFTLLMMHETEASFWKEWTYFGSFGKSLSDTEGLTIFTLARIPICIPLLYGLIKLPNMAGLIISLALSSFILFFHFPGHMLFLKSGRKEFRLPLSYGIQIGSFIVSGFQLAITVKLMA